MWHRLRVMGFNEKWVRWIKLCVTMVQYMLCMNGSYVGPVSLGRGLRQGDQLSPFLFLLCVEGMSHSLNVAANSRDINGCCISNLAPAITHLLFASDSFLFFKANRRKLNILRIS